MNLNKGFHIRFRHGETSATLTRNFGIYTSEDVDFLDFCGQFERTGVSGCALRLDFPSRRMGNSRLAAANTIKAGVAGSGMTTTRKARDSPSVLVPYPTIWPLSLTAMAPLLPVKPIESRNGARSVITPS